MNRSYSKIRHIQEANIRLEKRLLQEEPASPVTPDMQSLADFLSSWKCGPGGEWVLDPNNKNIK